jgi:nucleotide-binding universal stress UspA family protein
LTATLAEEATMFKKILIANDGSEGAFKALAVALEIGKSSKAQVHMICVEELPWMRCGSREEVISEKEMADRKFAEVEARAEAQAKRQRVKLTSHVVIGRPASAIVAFIGRDGFDLLVTGFKGHSALYHRILGKTTDRLVELAPCAVLVVK